MKWYIKVLKNYANFKDRARCREYWMFILINTIIFIVLGILFMLPNMIYSEFMLQSYNDYDYVEIINTINTIYLILYIIYSVYGLFILIPSLAVSVRRLHDIGKSGWFILISLIPIVGNIILMFWFSEEGMPETNKYGENPKLVE